MNDTINALKIQMSKSVLFMAGMLFQTYMTVKSAEFHREWIDALNGEKEKVCIIAPRGHGKSVVISIFWIIWRLLFTDSHYVIIISNTYDKAKNSLLLPIKDFFETSKLVKALFGDVRGDSWSKTSLEFFFRDAKGNVISKKKIDIFGVGQSIRGTRYLQYRPDTLIADDIEDDEQVDSSKRRNEIIAWFWEQVFPAMNKEGDVGDAGVFAVKPKMVIVGTILHYDSFLINLWKDYQARTSSGKETDWQVLKYSCVYDDNGVRKSLWDTRYSVEYWDKVREEMKQNGREQAFMQEYMNEPISDEERPIKVEHLKYYDSIDEIEWQQLDRFLAVDLAGSNTVYRGDQRDYNVVMVIGVNRGSGNIYVLDYAMFQTDDLNLTVNSIFEKQLEWQPKRGVFEQNAQQGYLKKMVDTEMRRTGMYFPFYPKTTENMRKEDRIKMVVGFNVGRGIVYIRKEMKDLYDQMYSFPNGKLKDLVDTLAYAIVASDSTSNFKDYLKLKTKEFLHKVNGYAPDDTDNPLYRGRNARRQYNYKRYNY